MTNNEHLFPDTKVSNLTNTQTPFCFNHYALHDLSLDMENVILRDFDANILSSQLQNWIKF
jgi:hypothetical protein